MTEKPVTTGVFDAQCMCPDDCNCHSSHRQNVCGCMLHPLPERADLPRIMDERTKRDNAWHDDAIRYGRPCPVVGCAHPHTGAGPFVATSITRDGSQVTR